MLLLCSSDERASCGFEATQRWVNDGGFYWKIFTCCRYLQRAERCGWMKTLSYCCVSKAVNLNTLNELDVCVRLLAALHHHPLSRNGNIFHLFSVNVLSQKWNRSSGWFQFRSGLLLFKLKHSNNNNALLKTNATEIK